MNIQNIANKITSLYQLSRYNPRRHSQIRTIGKSELVMEIYLELKLLEFSGETYWNYTKVLDGLYRRIGFTFKDNIKVKTLFEEAIKYVENKFIPMPGRRRNFSFKLKEDNSGVTARFLTH